MRPFHLRAIAFCLIGIGFSMSPWFASKANPSDAATFFLAQYPVPISISPDGKLALYKTRHMHDFEIMVIDLADGRKKLSQRSPHTQLALSWKPDSRQIAFLSVVPDNQQFQLHLWDLGANRVFAIPTPLTGVASLPLRWRPGASSLALYVGNTFAGNMFVVDLANLQHPVSTNVGSAFPGSDFTWSPDGKCLAYIPSDSPATIKLMQMTKDAPVFETLSPAKSGSIINEIAWSADGGKIAASVLDAQQEYTDLLIFDAKTANIVQAIRQSSDISAPFWLGSDHVLFEVNRNGLHALWMANVETGDRRQVGQLQGSHHVLSSAPGGTRVYDYWTRTDNLPSINALDPVSGTVEPIADSPKPSVPSIPPQMITLTAQDGNPVPAYIWEPPMPHRDKKAALIWVHGGPDQQELPVWDARIQWLARQGIIFVTVNYRGSRGYGASFRKQTDLEGEGLDILAVRDYLVNDKGIPEKNIILNGYSQGAVVATKALNLSPDGFGFFVLISALSNIQYYCPSSYYLHGVYGFHGEFDNLTAYSKAQKIFTTCFDSKPPPFQQTHWQVFNNEGHNFHQTGAWSDIDSAISRLTKENP